MIAEQDGPPMDTATVSAKKPPEVWVMPKPKDELCPECHTPTYPIAYNTGDGWLLSFSCACGAYGDTLGDYEIPWPFAENETASARLLESMGFKWV